MTKKDYKIIADSINAVWKTRGPTLVASVTIQTIVSSLCGGLKAENERFDKDIFKAACFKGD